jgi:mannose-6-phosphate isomerase-like protein (cupin superfamily)
MVRTANIVTQYDLRGGKGRVDFHHILSEEDMMGHGVMYAKMVLYPGSSIGTHQHIGETEPYYVLSGQGRFWDHDGTSAELLPGHVCWIDPGQSHGIENTSETELLEVMALKLFER